MKPFRITVILLALVVLLLFVGQVFAAVTYTRLDTLYVPWGKVSKNSNDKPLLGFRIDGVGSSDSLKSIIVLSFIQRAFSIDRLKLYMENNDTVGLQVGAGRDSLIRELNMYNNRYDSNYRGRFILSPRLPLHASPDSNLFYLAIDAHTDTVGKYPADFNGQCLEVVIEPDSLKLSVGSSNSDTIYNRAYGGVDDDTTGFCPENPDPIITGPDCRYRLCFDTFGPPFKLHFCVGDSTCPANQTISQGDTVQICATDILETIDGCIHIFGKVLADWDHEVTSKEMFLQDSIVLCDEEDGVRRSCDKCTPSWNTVFVIPDFDNGADYGPPRPKNGVDADTGQWFVCGWAKDEAGNVDTVCIGHDDLLPWKIDTRKPSIDSVSFFLPLWGDVNHDGKIGLGDTVAVFAWGSSNPSVPQLEVDSMIVRMPRFGIPRVWLNDVGNNNKVFRAYVCLDVAVPGLDTCDAHLNQITVWAWDNACNYDTLRDSIATCVDLDRPLIEEVDYKYYLDYDTSHSCIGIGDTVRIKVTTVGTDSEFVTADMKDAGIDSLVRTALPLPKTGDNTYDIIWQVTKPPIDDGKDVDNSEPPLRDSHYWVKVRVCDDAGNCVVDSGGLLNRTLDTRRPRALGYFCQDTVPCALHAVSQAGGIIKLYWADSCQENDAWYFYVYDSTKSTGGNWVSIGATYDGEYASHGGDPKFNAWYSEPLPEGYYYFKVQIEDNCDNLGPFSCKVAAFSDSTPPKACIVFPDSGGIYGDPFAVKARSEDQDINKVCLWYRLRHDLNDPPTGEAGQWKECLSAPCMYRPDSGLVFLDTVACIHDYVGWVELLPVSGDVIGNWQDTTRALEEACIDDSLQNLRDGHFLFYWDTTRACARVVSVNDTISPQTICGFNVNPDIMNEVVIDVDGADSTDLFTIDVRAIKKWKSSYRIDYRNNVTMPCTIMVSVDNWDFGTQHLYVRITSEANGKECVPYPMIIDLCVPWQTTPCITIARPLEWMRIPCSKTDKTCVDIWAEITPGCPESLVTQVKFFYSKNIPGPPWHLIEEVLEPDTEEVLGHPKLYWETCWNNFGLIDSTDTVVYFIAIGYNQYHIPDTSFMVKVFVDCKAPTVKLRIEDVITTCFGIPKVAGEIILKALVEDAVVDITELNFWYKLDSDPDIPAYWHKLCDGERGWCWECDDDLEPWSENIWAGEYDTEDLPNQTWIDIRVSVKDQAGNLWQDEDEDGRFDDSTFLRAVAAGAGMTVFVDNEAPQPAISMVADTAASIYNVNPSTLLGGSGEAYVKAGDDINSQISVIPSEDSCEVMKVEWYLCMPVEEDDVGFGQSPAQGGKYIPHDGNQGDNCEDPIELTLPRDLPFEDTNHTCGRGDDYDKTCLEKFDESEDIIYKLNVTTNVILRIQWWTSQVRNSGLALFSECPGRDGGPPLSGSNFDRECIKHEKGYKSQHWHHLSKWPIRLEPGTYYLMLDTPEKECIGRDGRLSGAGEIGQAPDRDGDYFELQITGEATGCKFVGLSNDPYHFPVNFNPVKDGLIPAYELEDHWWKGQLQAVLYDSLGNSKTDNVDLYILDVTPSQAVIVWPWNDGYVSGDVLLQSRVINDYEVCKVCYEYRPEGDSVWHPVNEGYPNACVTQEGNGPEGAAQRVGAWWPHRDWALTWHTLNTIPDGAYYLRAVATDCSNNVDTLPPTIKVTVSNGVPVVTLDDPRICSRECSDDTVDTLGYVGGTVPLYATVDSTIPVGYVDFYYKDIFQYPDKWNFIGRDNFPTDGKYSVEWNTPSDGRYHVKAVAVTYSWKSGESEWMVMSVDNTAPFSQIISIMGEDHLDYGVDISKGDVVPIEIVAKDWSSQEGWTRCYNSGLTKISVCIASCPDSCDTFWHSERGSTIDSIVCYPKDSLTKCFEVDSVYDGTHTVLWNTSGLEYEGCEGCYYIYVKAYDCLGNVTISDSVKVYVRDNTAPVTTIGGFDGNYVYGYSSERVKTLLFEYADSGTTNWTPIGWSDTLRIRSYAEYWAENCGYYLYKTSWDPASLTEGGHYQIRVISHDTCSNQNDSLAPVAYFSFENGTIIPYHPEGLGALSFEKNWCVGGMHGIVKQTSTLGDPVMFGRYNSTYECIDMQAHLQNTDDYAGSFFAGDIEYGGPAEFFSSVTVPGNDEVGPAYVTYLRQGNFDVVQVKRDVGTHGTYQDGCVEVTIPGGAVGGTFTYDRYIWVSPTTMPWTPVTQPQLNPIGDNNGYATYVAFTDCYYCCGWFKSQFGGEQGDISQSRAQGYSDCCFNPGRYAKIKMCYDSTVTTSKEHLAVMWWDCQSGEFCFDSIYYPPWVEGFNTENHTVEFAVPCLSGPFAVVELVEPPCDGSIVVNMRAVDIEPYSNGYTNTMPTFTSFINDRVQGTQAIDQSSIQFKLDLFNPGELIRIYTGVPSDLCDRWMTGFGSFSGAGYDPVPGIFKAGWNNPAYRNPSGDFSSCTGCYNYYCQPAYPLKAGNHTATVSAQNHNIQSCTDTVYFTVDATAPTVHFPAKWVSMRNPVIKAVFEDTESGVDKASAYVDVWDVDESQQPFAQKRVITYSPSMTKEWWRGDTLIITMDRPTQGQYLHVYIYDGSFTDDETYGLWYRYYDDGVSDRVGNKARYAGQVFPTDHYAPRIALAKESYRFRRPVRFNITDPDTLYYAPFYSYGRGSGIASITVEECTSPTGGCVNTLTIPPDAGYIPNPGILDYTPTVPGNEGVWLRITASDTVGNYTVKDSIYCVEDFDPPMVTFLPSYYNGTTVCKDDPTIKFVVTDGAAGVNWNTVNVTISGCDQSITYPFTEVINHMQNDTVTLAPPINNCSDGSAIKIYVYSDTKDGKGPADNGDTYLKNAATWTYYADASGPTITLKTPSDSLFNRPLLFEIKDTKSGLANIEVFQDSQAVDIIDPYAHNPGWYALSPSEGQHKINIVATDSCGNSTNYFIFTKDDWTPPVVSFTPSWINCTNPKVTFQITDDVAGVDWSKVNVDLYYSSTRIQTFTPLEYTYDLNGFVTVTGDGDLLGLTDNAALNVVVYSQKNYSTSYARGPVDLAGNYRTSTDYYLKTYYADCVGPTITWLNGVDSCASLLRFEIKDARSGLATIAITEDGDTVTTGFYYNDTTQILSYLQPSAGRHNVKIKATDNVGNPMVFEFWSKADCTPPTVAFGGGYISCADPTVSIEVTDDASGVDWGTLHVDLWTSTYRLQTFYPGDLVGLRSGNTITVTADGDLFSLADGNLLKVAVYSYKTSETGYIKGPTDSAGNWTQTQWIQKEYYVDCLAPTISWINSSDPCDRPIKLQIADNKSGVAEVKAYEDGDELNGEGEAFFYDPTSGLWHLYPSAGVHNIDVVATDVVGNQNTKSFEVKNDCLPPGVKFVGEYVTKNPTVKIVLKDDNVGIDWNTVNVDLYQRDYPYKQCTFTAADIANFGLRHGDTVVVSCIMDLTDGKTLIAYVYAEKISGTGTSPSYGRGPADLSSNYMPKWQECIYQVDAGPPSIIVTNLSERPIWICFSDSGSGIDWSTLEFYEDSVLICQGLACMDTNVHLDTVKNCMAYEPGAGRKYVEIRVKDHAGNLIIYSFWTEEQNLFFTNPHNYPNPFDPRELSTYIDLGLSKSAHVTVKIYDFAGEFVRELQTDKFIGISTPILWDGKTDDGTEVANGTYLCYIHARDDSGKVETAVIKITVLKKDK